MIEKYPYVFGILLFLMILVSFDLHYSINTDVKKYPKPFYVCTTDCEKSRLEAFKTRHHLNINENS